MEEYVYIDIQMNYIIVQFALFWRQENIRKKDKEDYKLDIYYVKLSEMCINNNFVMNQAKLLFPLNLCEHKYQ